MLAEAVRPDPDQATGTFGFNRYPAKDRRFDVCRAGALRREHLETYVVPVILTGRIKPHGTPLPGYLEAVPHDLRRIVLLGPWLVPAVCLLRPPA